MMSAGTAIPMMRMTRSASEGSPPVRSPSVTSGSGSSGARSSARLASATGCQLTVKGAKDETSAMPYLTDAPFFAMKAMLLPPSAAAPM